MATCRGALGVHKPGPSSGGNDSELDVFAAERYFNGDDALWCARSSSSFSSAFRTNEHDASVVTVTAATSSSEASWNSRSALLTGGNVHAAAATVEAEQSERTREGKPRPSPPPLLRRWILGVAGCACLGGDGESLARADDLCRDQVEEDHNVDGNRGKKLPDGVERQSKELPAAEAASVRVRPGMWLDGGEELQVHLGGNGHRRAVNSGEFPTPILNPATTAGLLPEYRRKSSEMLRFPLSQIGSALLPTKQDSTFTIVAGNTTRLVDGLHAAGGGGGGRAAALGEPGTISLCDSIEDDAVPSELGCAYPPSEASVVWSVVTAEGAASCNFSSAASGYYYRFNGGEDSTTRHAEAKGKCNRRRGSRREQHHGGLLTCMGDKAVNAVRPAHSDNWNRPSAGHSDVNRRR